MPYNIKGITVEINGDTSKLQEELDRVKAKTSGLTKSMRQVDKASKLDPHNVETLALKAELTTTRMGSLAQQLALVKKGIADFPAQVKGWEDSLQRIRDRQAELQEQYHAQLTSLTQLTSQSEILKQKETERTSIVDRYRASLSEQVANQQELEAELNKQTELYNKQFDKVTRVKEEVASEKQKLVEIGQELERLVNEWQKQENVVNTSKSALERERSVLKEMSSDIEKMNAEQKEQEQLVNMLNQAYKEESHALLDIEQAMGKGSQEYIRQEQVVDAIIKELDVEEQKLAQIKQNVDEATRKYQTQSEAVKIIEQRLREEENALAKAKRLVDEQTERFEQQKDRVARVEKQLADERKTLQEIEKNVGKTSEEYQKQSQVVKNVESNLKLQEKELDNIRSDIDKTNSSIEESEKNIEEITKEFDQLETSAKNVTRQIETAPQKMAAMKVQAQSLIAEFNKLANTSIGNNQKIIEMYNALDRVADAGEKAYQKTKWLSSFSLGALTGVVKTAMDFESAWTGVLKTVQGTPMQLEQVNNGLKELATTTNSTYEEIAHYGELGGQMGIATKDIVDFTRTITELNDTTNLVGDEAAQSIAKIKNIFKGDADVDVEYWSQMGSAIVDLGNNFATTERDIVEMTQVMGSYTRLAGFNEKQTLALATTLSSLGIEANAGGSSMGQLINKIDTAVSKGGESLDKFASTAKMDAQKFADAWKNDPVEALTSLLEGMGSVENLNTTLGELGISNIRVTRATKSLTGATDLLERALKTSNEAWDENIAMDEEASRRYETTAAKLKELWEQLKQVGASLGEELLPTIKTLVDGAKDVVEAFSEMDDGTKKFIINSLLLGTTIAPISKGLVGIGKGGKKAIEFFTKGSKMARLLGNSLGVGNEALNTFVDSLDNVELSNLEKAGADLDKLNYSFTSLASAVKKNGLGKTFSDMFKSMGLLGQFASTVGIAGAGMFALAGFGKMYSDQLERQLEEESKVYKQAKLTVDRNKELAESIELKRKASEEYVNAVDHNDEASKEYMKTLTSMMGDEEKSTGEIALMKSAIENLNEMYPNLGWSIDETSGKILDNTGKVIDNTKALEENLEAQKKSFAQESYANALKETSSAIVEQEIAQRGLTKEIQQADKEWQDYYDAYHKALDNGEMGKATELQTKLNDLGRVLGDLNTQARDGSKALMEMRMQEAELSNASESGSLDKFGESLTKQFESLQDTAKDFGINLPKEIKDGMNGESVDVQNSLMWQGMLQGFADMRDLAKIKGKEIPDALTTEIINGAPDLETAIDYLNNITNFQGMVLSAGIAGKDVPQEIVKQIASGEMDVQQATERLADYATFQTLVNNAGKSGDEAAKKLGSSLMNGDISLENASKEMGLTLDEGLREGTRKAIENSSQTVEDIKSTVAKGDLTKEGTNMGSSFSKSIGSQFKEALGIVEGYISKIKNASNVTLTPKVQASVSHKDSKSNESSLASSYSRMSKRMPFGDSIGGANYVVQSSEPNINEQLMGTKLGRQLQNTFDTSKITEMVNKLDNVVNALLDASININLAPQQLDGNAITDSVQETIAIRDMLKNYGMGV